VLHCCHSLINSTPSFLLCCFVIAFVGVADAIYFVMLLFLLLALVPFLGAGAIAFRCWYHHCCTAVGANAFWCRHFLVLLLFGAIAFWCWHHHYAMAAVAPLPFSCFWLLPWLWFGIVTSFLVAVAVLMLVLLWHCFCCCIVTVGMVYYLLLLLHCVHFVVVVAAVMVLFTVSAAAFLSCCCCCPGTLFVLLIAVAVPLFCHHCRCSIILLWLLLQRHFVMAVAMVSGLLVFPRKCHFVIVIIVVPVLAVLLWHCASCVCCGFCCCSIVLLLSLWHSVISLYTFSRQKFLNNIRNIIQKVEFMFLAFFLS